MVYPVTAWNEGPDASPLVSVVIPCYNHAHFLGEAIESALNQTHPHVEVVVVDDGSTDGSAAVAARYAARYPAVRCIRQENQGLSAACNAGLRASTGAFLTFLGSDDRLLPHAVEAGLDAFRAHPECAFVYGAYYWVNADGTFDEEGWATEEVHGDHYAEMLRRNFIAMHAAVLLRRRVLAAVGGFDTALPHCEDFDLYLRITREHPIHCHGRLVAEYRRHGSNKSGSPSRMLRATLHVLRKQRRFVQHDARLRRAYAEGVRFWKDCYGSDLATHLDRLWRQGRVREALREEGVLLRYAPAWFVRHLKRNAARGAKKLARGRRRMLAE